MADIAGSPSTPAPGPDPTAPAVVDDSAPPAPADGAPPPAVPAATPTPEPVAAKRPDLTGRLAALSKQSREAARAARTAEQRAKAAESKAADFEAILSKAATDPSAMDALFSKAGLTFDTIVNRYADATPQLTPEQARDKAIEELRAETAAIKKAREDEVNAARNAAAQRQAEAARAETLGSIAQTIAKQADKYEICARLGEEAANDVFAEVVSTWNKAGRPELMPGEFEEAVAAAIEHQELIYEDRGRKLAKGQRTPAATPAAATAAKTGLTPKGEPLPDGLIRGALSEKDEDILKGLTDKTAPAYESQRAKPRTINSSLGGSAPPRAPARGAMDPRDALREVLMPFQRQ
jgi:hypothetical protein